METKGEINISPKYRKDDYLNLNLTINSGEIDWGKAIDIFKDRIVGRYFDQINALSNDINANGFTIMALNCLLIEALFQFRDGKDMTPGKNSKAYPRFLVEEFPHVFDVTSADLFYQSIRCGILHSAQTKEGARLSDDDSFIVNLVSGELVVSVLGITNQLKHYFDTYVNKLRDPNQRTIRTNFVKKMKFICR